MILRAPGPPWWSFARPRAVVSGALVLSIAGCGASDRSVASASDQTLRSPEGVVLEVPPVMPAPVEVALSGGVVVLGEPVPDEAIRELLFAFFDGFRRRDREAVQALLAGGAVTIDARGVHGNKDALLDRVSSAMRAQDYSKIVPVEIVAAERIDRASSADVAATGRKRTEPLGPLDVLVRVVMPETRGAGEKPFADALVFLLRPEEGRLKIVTFGEQPATAPFP